MHFSYSSFLIILPLAFAASTPPKPVVLANGTSMQAGVLSNGVKWQASGILTQNCLTPTTNPISSCYGLSLTSNPSSQLDPSFPSPRQRIEFRVPSIPKSLTKTYTFKTYLTPNTSTSSKFFHLMQIFDEDLNTPLVALSAVNGSIILNDFVRPSCTTNLGCPSIPIKTYWGKTTLHRVVVTSGPKGALNYSVVDVAAPQALMISYNMKGYMGNSTAYLKYGAYRATFSPNMTYANVSVGDFTSS